MSNLAFSHDSDTNTYVHYLFGGLQISLYTIFACSELFRKDMGSLVCDNGVAGEKCIAVSVISDGGEDNYEALRAPLLKPCPSRQSAFLLSDGLSEISTTEGVTTFRAVLNGMNVLAGVGILSTPYAVFQGGWLGISILFLASIMCCYTGILLQKCMESPKHAPNSIRLYPDIGEAAFGKQGRYLISACLYSELYAFAVAFFILEGDNLAQLFPETMDTMHILGITMTTQQALVLLSALVIMPTVWLRDLKFLAYVSAFGVATCFVQLFSVICVGLSSETDSGHHGTVINLRGLPVAIGLYIFCFGGHAVFPCVYSSMAERKRYPQVLYISFIICTLMYAGMGVAGYMMFGDKVQSQITLNLPKDSIASKVAIYTTIITPFAKYSLIMNPLAVGLEEVVHSWLPTSSRTRFLLMSISVRTALVLSTVGFAIALPVFGYIMSFIGSFLTCTISIIIPCCCYLKMYRSSISNSQLTVIISVISCGFIATVVGTYSSLQSLVGSST